MQFLLPELAPILRLRRCCILGARAPNTWGGNPRASRSACSRPTSPSSLSLSPVVADIPEGPPPAEKTKIIQNYAIFVNQGLRNSSGAILLISYQLRMSRLCLILLPRLLRSTDFPELRMRRNLELRYCLLRNHFQTLQHQQHQHHFPRLIYELGRMTDVYCGIYQILSHLKLNFFSKNNFHATGWLLSIEREHESVTHDSRRNQTLLISADGISAFSVLFVYPL